MTRHGMNLDIHSYETKYATIERLVRSSKLSDRNKDFVIGFRDACVLHQVCGKPRLIRAMGVLIQLGTMLRKDFDTVTKEDLQRVIAGLLQHQPAYSPGTLGTIKAVTRRFIAWVLAPNVFPSTKQVPDAVAWITCHVRKREQRRLQRNDLVMPQEIERVIDACHSPRDKALVAVLWETGARVAEIGNLQIKHLTKAPQGYVLDVDGKTGQRSPLIVSSAPYLSTWLANHPFKDQPDAPLWVHYRYEKSPHMLKYDTIRFLLTSAFARAGITKRVHPHLFRHSRATFVLANGIMTEGAAKRYFGWTPDSGMLATYAHLVDQDANNAILRENNLAPLQEHDQELRPVRCTVCGELNPPRTDWCTKCGAVLNLRKAYVQQQAHTLKDDVVLHLVKILVQNGLLDQAAQTIHEAGLGSALKQLATAPANRPALGETTSVPHAAPLPPVEASPTTPSN
jgi:integrase